jgi:hypothetical protein
MNDSRGPSSVPAGHLLPASGEKDTSRLAELADDPLACFAYVEPVEDEDLHVHSCGCTCHLRGV